MMLRICYIFSQNLSAAYMEELVGENQAVYLWFSLDEDGRKINKYIYHDDFCYFDLTLSE
jgi:hypothetical protein